MLGRQMMDGREGIILKSGRVGTTRGLSLGKVAMGPMDLLRPEEVGTVPMVLRQQGGVRAHDGAAIPPMAPEEAGTAQTDLEEAATDPMVPRNLEPVWASLLKDLLGNQPTPSADRVVMNLLILAV